MLNAERNREELLRRQGEAWKLLQDFLQKVRDDTAVWDSLSPTLRGFYLVKDAYLKIKEKDVEEISKVINEKGNVAKEWLSKNNGVKKAPQIIEDTAVELGKLDKPKVNEVNSQSKPSLGLNAAERASMESEGEALASLMSTKNKLAAPKNMKRADNKSDGIEMQVVAGGPVAGTRRTQSRAKQRAQPERQPVLAEEPSQSRELQDKLKSRPSAPAEDDKRKPKLKQRDADDVFGLLRPSNFDQLFGEAERRAKPTSTIKKSTSSKPVQAVPAPKSIREPEEESIYKWLLDNGFTPNLLTQADLRQLDDKEFRKIGELRDDSELWEEFGNLKNVDKQDLTVSLLLIHIDEAKEGVAENHQLKEERLRAVQQREAQKRLNAQPKPAASLASDPSPAGAENTVAIDLNLGQAPAAIAQAVESVSTSATLPKQAPPPKAAALKETVVRRVVKQAFGEVVPAQTASVTIEPSPVLPSPLLPELATAQPLFHKSAQPHDNPAVNVSAAKVKKGSKDDSTIGLSIPPQPTVVVAVSSAVVQGEAERMPKNITGDKRDAGGDMKTQRVDVRPGSQRTGEKNKVFVSGGSGSTEVVKGTSGADQKAEREKELKAMTAPLKELLRAHKVAIAAASPQTQLLGNMSKLIFAHNNNGQWVDGNAVQVDGSLVEFNNNLKGAEKAQAQARAQFFQAGIEAVFASPNKAREVVELIRGTKALLPAGEKALDANEMEGFGVKANQQVVGQDDYIAKTKIQFVEKYLSVINAKSLSIDELGNLASFAEDLREVAQVSKEVAALEVNRTVTPVIDQSVVPEGAKIVASSVEPQSPIVNIGVATMNATVSEVDIKPVMEQQSVRSMAVSEVVTSAMAVRSSGEISSEVVQAAALAKPEASPSPAPLQRSPAADSFVESAATVVGAKQKLPDSVISSDDIDVSFVASSEVSEAQKRLSKLPELIAGQFKKYLDNDGNRSLVQEVAKLLHQSGLSSLDSHLGVLPMLNEVIKKNGHDPKKIENFGEAVSKEIESIKRIELASKKPAIQDTTPKSQEELVRLAAVTLTYRDEPKRIPIEFLNKLKDCQVSFDKNLAQKSPGVQDAVNLMKIYSLGDADMQALVSPANQGALQQKGFKFDSGFIACAQGVHLQQKEQEEREANLKEKLARREAELAAKAEAERQAAEQQQAALAAQQQAALAVQQQAALAAQQQAAKAEAERQAAKAEAERQAAKVEAERQAAKAEAEKQAAEQQQAAQQQAAEKERAEAERQRLAAEREKQAASAKAAAAPPSSGGINSTSINVTNTSNKLNSSATSVPAQPSASAQPQPQPQPQYGPQPLQVAMPVQPVSMQAKTKSTEYTAADFMHETLTSGEKTKFVGMGIVACLLVLTGNPIGLLIGAAIMFYGQSKYSELEDKAALKAKDANAEMRQNERANDQSLAQQQNQALQQQFQQLQGQVVQLQSQLQYRSQQGIGFAGQQQVVTQQQQPIGARPAIGQVSHVSDGATGALSASKTPSKSSNKLSVKLAGGAQASEESRRENRSSGAVAPF